MGIGVYVGLKKIRKTGQFGQFWEKPDPVLLSRKKFSPISFLMCVDLKMWFLENLILAKITGYGCPGIAWGPY